MTTDRYFFRWAARFLRARGNEPVPVELPDINDPYAALSPAARELLRSVDAGGVPAFVTGRLKKIAAENGVEIDGRWTPDAIVNQLRIRAQLDLPDDRSARLDE